MADMTGMNSEWYLSEEQVEEAYRQHHEWAKRRYAEVAREYGEEAAEGMAGQLFDGHDCSQFSRYGGYCEFCGRLIPGSPAWREEYGDERGDVWW